MSCGELSICAGILPVDVSISMIRTLHFETRVSCHREVSISSRTSGMETLLRMCETGLEVERCEDNEGVDLLEM